MRSVEKGLPHLCHIYTSTVTSQLIIYNSVEPIRPLQSYKVLKSTINFAAKVKSH